MIYKEPTDGKWFLKDDMMDRAAVGVVQFLRVFVSDGVDKRNTYDGISSRITESSSCAGDMKNKRSPSK